MNSVISAFKTKKSNAASPTAVAPASNVATADGKVGLTIASAGGGTRKKPVVQDNGYQYLRQIREIETANKLLSPVVAVAADDLNSGDKLHFRPATDAAVVGADVVDHCAPAMVRLSCVDTKSDYNMNGKANSIASNHSMKLAENGNMDIYALGCDQHSPPLPDDDDNSEHSTAACNSTSSSSDHSNSTVVQSPTVVVQPNPQTSSPNLGRDCSLSSLSVNGEPHSASSTTLSSLNLEEPLVECSSESENGCQPPLGSPVLTKAHDDYVPAFLKAPPITLPLSKAACSLSTGSTPTISSAASTPKHVRYAKPRLSLSRGFNQSMPSVHGRPNLSLAPTGAGLNGAQTGGLPPKRISTHQRNLSLDFR